ncbi:12403_t:CDS:2, partial [Ambispora leptoticha]
FLGRKLLENNSKPSEENYQRTAPNFQETYQRTAQTQQRKLRKKSSKSDEKNYKRKSPNPTKKLEAETELDSKPDEETNGNLLEAEAKSELASYSGEQLQDVKENYQRTTRNFEESSLTFWSLSLIELPENYQRTALKHAEQWRRCFTKLGRKQHEKLTRVRWYELLRLPYFNPIQFLAIDPMHCLFLGIAKWIVKRLWVDHRKLNTSQLKQIQKKMSEIQDYLSAPDQRILTNFVRICTILVCRIIDISVLEEEHNRFILLIKQIE